MFERVMLVVWSMFVFSLAGIWPDNPQEEKGQKRKESSIRIGLPAEGLKEVGVEKRTINLESGPLLSRKRFDAVFGGIIQPASLLPAANLFEPSEPQPATIEVSPDKGLMVKIGETRIRVDSHPTLEGAFSLYKNDNLIILRNVSLLAQTVVDSEDRLFISDPYQQSWIYTGESPYQMKAGDRLAGNLQVSTKHWCFFITRDEFGKRIEFQFCLKKEKEEKEKEAAKPDSKPVEPLPSQKQGKKKE